MKSIVVSSSVRFAIAALALFFQIQIPVFSQGSSRSETVIYVSPHGDDHHEGHLETPVRTIRRASQIAQLSLFRSRISEGSSNVTIVFRQGVYRLSEPWVLQSEQWLKKESSLTIRSYPGERVILSGGWPIAQWSVGDHGVLTASVADYPGDLSGVRELFVGDKRATRARFPDSGFLRVESTGEDRRTNFTFYEGDIRPVPDLEACELVFFHDWSTSRVGIKSLDFSERKLTVTDSIGPNASHYAINHFEQHPRYYLEHSRSFLNRPGEWFLDVESKELHYMPLEGETPSSIKAVLPLAPQLIRVIGKPEKPFQNLHIQGLIFEHTSWSIPERGYAAGQSTYHERRHGEGGTLRELIPAAIEMQFVRNCSLNGNVIRHLGNSGVHLGAWAVDNRIEMNHVHHVSGNGILIGEDSSRMVDGQAWWRSAPDQVASNNTVSGNLVEDCGVQFYGAVGIWVGLTKKTYLGNNTIRNLPYTGISMGWMWNPTPTPAAENMIYENHIHHVMQVLSDGGGIYTLGRQPNSQIQGNHIHDIPLNLGRAESNGMFLDEGTTGFSIQRNLIYNIDRSPLRFHRATTNMVEGNVLYLSDETIPPVRYNNTPEEMIRLKSNAIKVQTVKRLEEIPETPKRFRGG